MKAGKKGTRRRQRPFANGRALRLGAFREAYYDALYAREMEEIERWLRDPRTSDLLKRQTKELLEEMLRHVEA